MPWNNQARRPAIRLTKVVLIGTELRVSIMVRLKVNVMSYKAKKYQQNKQ